MGEEICRTAQWTGDKGVAVWTAWAIRLESLVRSGAIATYAEAAELGHAIRSRVSQITSLQSLAPDVPESLRNGIGARWSWPTCRRSRRSGLGEAEADVGNDCSISSPITGTFA